MYVGKFSESKVLESPLKARPSEPLCSSLLYENASTANYFAIIPARLTQFGLNYFYDSSPASPRQ